MSIQEGKPAPSFSLEDAESAKVSLADFLGKNLILYFYPKDDTPGCTKEACGFRDDWKEIQKLDAVVVGVSVDGVDSHRKFAAKYKLPFPLLSDPERTVMRKYGAYGEKVLYGKKTVGVIRSTLEMPVVNHRLPSGPAVIQCGYQYWGRSNSVITPVTDIRPIRPW